MGKGRPISTLKCLRHLAVVIQDHSHTLLQCSWAEESNKSQGKKKKNSPRRQRLGRMKGKRSREDQHRAEEGAQCMSALSNAVKLFSTIKPTWSFGSDARRQAYWLTSALHQRGTVTGYYHVDQ